MKNLLRLRWTWFLIAAILSGPTSVCADKVERIAVFVTGGVKGDIEPCG